MWNKFWKILHPYAEPQRAYELTGKFLPWVGIIAFLMITTGTALGLFFAPVDYQQGDSYRIIFIHVPAASMSLMAYMAMAVCAFVGLVWQIKLSDWMAASIAPVGALVALLALITGATWGKPMWGTWWVWDARLTSELILLFIYLGIISLYSSFEDKVLAARAAGILTLVGAINIPIIKYSVDWWSSLHQPAMNIAKSKMPPEMVIPLVVNILGFGMLIATIALIRFRTEILARNGMRPWVRELAKQQGGK